MLERKIKKKKKQINWWENDGTDLIGSYVTRKSEESSNMGTCISLWP